MKSCVYDLFEKTAVAGLRMQNENGSMPEGHNGPHNHESTPVVTTAHWLVTFSKMYKTTGKKIFLDAARKSLNYLISSSARPNNSTFYCRTSEKRDRCNGLIGQAWVIQSLFYAGRIVNYSKAIDLATYVFLLHKFDDKKGLWHSKEVDGKVLEIDRTLNHQIYFAASGVESKNSQVISKILLFLDNLGNYYKTNSLGLINHRLFIETNNSLPNKARFSVGRALDTLTGYFKPELDKEVGYHQFNLMGLALLKDKYNKNKFWQSPYFKKSLTYILTDSYQKKLDKNIYGYPYNVAGIENAIVIEKFLPEQVALKKKYLNRQFKLYDHESGLMKLNTFDSVTLSARIFESVWLDDMKKEFVDEN